MIRECLLFVLLGQAGVTPQDRKATFDLSADFTFAQTADSVWQYGYSVANSLAADQFRQDTFLDHMAPISFWHPSTNDRRGPGYYPYVAYNGTNQSQLEPTHSWAARAGQVALEGSNSGQYSLIRFVVPFSGTYHITARFEGIHFRLSSTDVHVLHNSAHLFDADIEGYGGDSAFHAVEGARPSASYENSTYLAAHDVVTFAVGYGKNKRITTTRLASSHDLSSSQHLRKRGTDNISAQVRREEYSHGNPR